MFASIVSPHRCELFTVVRTDLNSWDREVLTYPPSDFPTAVKRAADYQRRFGQDGRFDYRVCHHD